MYAEHIPLILNLNNTNLISNTAWAIVDSTATVIIGIVSFRKAQKYRKDRAIEKDNLISSQHEEITQRDANDAVKAQLEAFEDKFDEKIDEMNQVLTKINYALFNAGKTGLVNKVDSMLVSQNEFAIALEVLKVKSEK